MPYHSPELDLWYDPVERVSPVTGLPEIVLRFTDGVEYTLREAVIVAEGFPSKVDLMALHRVKSAFDGEVLPRPVLEGAGGRPVQTGPESISALLDRLERAKPGDFGFAPGDVVKKRHFWEKRPVGTGLAPVLLKKSAGKRRKGGNRSGEPVLNPAPTPSAPPATLTTGDALRRRSHRAVRPDPRPRDCVQLSLLDPPVPDQVLL